MDVNATGGAALLGLVPHLDAGLEWAPVRGPGIQVSAGDERLAVTVVVQGDQFAAIVEYGAPLEPIGPVDEPAEVAARIVRMVAVGVPS